MIGGRRQAMLVLALARRTVSAERLAHSRRVAALSGVLCRRFGVDPDLGRLAGLGHDVAREMDRDTLRALAASDGLPVDDDERSMPVLLHGRASAVLLGREAEVTAADVLEAVRDHVTGRPGMGTLARILFAADYLEPGRGFLEEARRRAALASGLDGMVGMVVRDTIVYLERRGRGVARRAKDLAAELA